MWKENFDLPEVSVDTGALVTYSIQSLYGFGFILRQV